MPSEPQAQTFLLNAEQVKEAKESARPKDRLTVILQIHHQSQGEPVTSQECRFNRVTGDEQPFPRRISVKAGQAHDMSGWVKNPGYLFVQNRTDIQPDRNLSAEEKAEKDNKIVHLVPATGEGVTMVLRPGDVALLPNTNPEDWRLVAQDHDVQVTFVIYPA